MDFQCPPVTSITNFTRMPLPHWPPHYHCATLVTQDRNSLNLKIIFPTFFIHNTNANTNWNSNVFFFSNVKLSLNQRIQILESQPFQREYILFQTEIPVFPFIVDITKILIG